MCWNRNCVKVCGRSPAGSVVMDCSPGTEACCHFAAWLYWAEILKVDEEDEEKEKEEEVEKIKRNRERKRRKEKSGTA